MAAYCMSCGKTLYYEDLEEDEPGEPDVQVEPPEECEPEEPEFHHRGLCGSCGWATDERYSRPAHMCGLTTLGDFMIESFDRQGRFFGEALDPDINEVLPRVAGGSRPAQERTNRDEAQLNSAIGRIGRPLCLSTPESFKENNLPEPFLLCSLRTGSEGVFLSYGYHLEVVEERPEFANAWEYAPDGTPLGDAN